MKQLIVQFVFSLVAVLISSNAALEYFFPPEISGSIQQAPRFGKGNFEGMVYVSPGSFIMGSEAAADQLPVRRLNLDGFWIDRSEVTAREFDSFLRLNNLSNSGPPVWLASGDLDPEMAEHPAYPVSWKLADEYCRKLGKRLPSEAQWEKAARGSMGSNFPWGEKWDNQKSNNAYLNIWKTIKSRPGGSFPDGASPYGAQDMAGNVREWVQDSYEPDAYASRFIFKPLWVDPPHVLRGGSFAGSHHTHTGSHRSHRDINPERRDYGFRCAMEDRP